MRLTFTPGQVQRQSEFYRQLGSMLHAGVSILSALEHLRQQPPGAQLGLLAGALISRLQTGLTIAEALRSLEDAIPQFDLALIEAGEKSGRLDSCFKLLGEHYDNRARMTRQMINDFIYPVALLHFAVFILPFPNLFLTGNLMQYLFSTFSVLLPIYAVVLAIVLACQGRHGEAWRSTIERIAAMIPLVGKARHKLALARLCAALEALINAGVPVFQAWELAGQACGSPALRREIATWQPRWKMGLTPAETIRTSSLFPSLFAGLYSGGEVSGRLDHELRHLHDLYQEEGFRLMQNVMRWTPKIVYFAIMLVIAYKIISFYAGYFGQIKEVL